MLVIHNLGRIPEYYRHFAGNKVRALYERAEGGSLTEWYRLANGCVLRIKVVGDHGYIRLKCGGCPALINGLMDPVVDASHPTALYNDEVDGETIQQFHRFYEKDDTDWQNTKKMIRAGPQSITKRPGLYSGLMRKVVQGLLGTNQEVPYNYTFATTHGVYVATDGSHHVIEISSAGVFTWPLPACTASTSVDGLEYTPLNKTRPEDPTQIAEASAVADAYSKTPIFSACGWAFSQLGRKASNVVYSESGGYYTAYLYTITFNGADSPTAAIMSEVESDYLWGDRVTHIKYPDYDDGTIKSFDWTTSVSEPGEDSDTPVFCFYVGETLQTARFIRTVSDSFSSNFNTSETYLNGASAVFIPGGTYEIVSGTQETRSFEIGTVESVASRTYTGQEGATIEVDSWTGIYAQTGFNNRSYTDVIGTAQEDFTNVSATEEYIEALVIAYGDREACFHARQYTKTGTADREVLQVGFYGYGHWWGSSADTLNGGSVLWTTEIAAGDVTPPSGADGSVRAHNVLNEIGDAPDVGGVATTWNWRPIYLHEGYFYGLSGTPEEQGALPYAQSANEDAYGGDPCFTGTTRIDEIGTTQYTLTLYQSYISYSVTPPCTGPAETVGQLVYQVSKYWFGSSTTVSHLDYEEASAPYEYDETTRTAKLIRGGDALRETSITAGDSDFTTTWCQFLEDGDYQMMLVIPDCSDDEKTAYLDGIDLEYATFPDDMLGGGTYPVTELSHLHACFIGNP